MANRAALRRKSEDALDRKDKRKRYYFRRRGMPAIPLPGAPGSEEFMAAYG
jgi:hypothetical protein